MSKNANLPFHFYVNVNNEFLGPQMPRRSTKGIWHAVYSRVSNFIVPRFPRIGSSLEWSSSPCNVD